MRPGIPCTRPGRSTSAPRAASARLTRTHIGTPTQPTRLRRARHDRPFLGVPGGLDVELVLAVVTAEIERGPLVPDHPALRRVRVHGLPAYPVDRHRRPPT